MYCIFLEKRSNVVFWFSEKAGCTYVKSLFLRHVGIHRAWPHQLPKEILPRTNLNYNNEISNPVHILFIRNPYKRIVSGFLDKLTWKPGFPPDRDGFKTTFEIGDEISFEVFIKNLSNHRIFGDPHFNRQTSMAYDRNIYLNKVFDLERIDLSYLDNLFQTSIEDPGRGAVTLYRNHGGEKPAYKLPIAELDQMDFKPGYQQFYNAEIKKEVEALYEKDFQLFARLGFNYEID